MTHDPLCPLIVDGVEGPLDLYECPCDLIAKVREDEREQAVERMLRHYGNKTPTLGIQRAVRDVRGQLAVQP
jgi:hypothetical protein